MRTPLIFISAGLLAACATTQSPFPEAESGPLTAAELAHSFDSAVASRLTIFTRADRDCSLERAAQLAVEAGEPDPEAAVNAPRVFVEGSGGGLRQLPSVSARELAAAGVVREAAIECQRQGDD